MRAVAQSSRGQWMPGDPPRGQMKCMYQSSCRAQTGAQERSRSWRPCWDHRPLRNPGVIQGCPSIPSPVRCYTREGKEGVSNAERLSILPQRTRVDQEGHN